MHVGLCVFFYPFYSLFSSTILMLFFMGSVHTTFNTVYFSFFLLPYNPKSNPSSFISKPQNPDFLYDPLIHYPIANALWNMIFKLFGVMWVMTEGVEDLLNSWKPGTEGWVDPKVIRSRARSSIVSGGAFGVRGVHRLLRDGRNQCLILSLFLSDLYLSG